MSGLESVAAIIGITDAAFRSISLLYESFEDIKTAPREVQSLKRELGSLQHCLTQLQHLSTRDEKALSVIKGFGLQEVLELCAHACEPLRAITQNWSSSVAQEWRLRFQFVLNKKGIQRARDNVSSAKQTTILAVVIAQLSLELLESSSPKEKLQKIEEAERKVARMTSYGEQDRYASHRKAPTLVDDSGQYSEQGYTGLRHRYLNDPKRLSTQQAIRDNEYSQRSPSPPGRQTYYSEDSNDESTVEDTGRSADGRAYLDSLAQSERYSPPSGGYDKALKHQTPPLHQEPLSGSMTQQWYRSNSVQHRDSQYPQHAQWSGEPNHVPYAQLQTQSYHDQNAGQRENPDTSYSPSESGYSTKRSQYADANDYLHRAKSEVEEGISNKVVIKEVAGEDNEFADIERARYIKSLSNDVRVGTVSNSAKKNRVGCIRG